MATLLGIEPLLARHPAGLSGGEAQRVALAGVHRSTGVTVLHVTHDSRESRRLADVCFVIEAGEVARRDAAVAPGAMS